MLKQIKLKNTVKARQTPVSVTLVSSHYCNTKLLLSNCQGISNPYIRLPTGKEKYKDNKSPGVSQLDRTQIRSLREMSELDYHGPTR